MRNQIELQPDVNYMQRQVYINNEMRSVLVDWLVEVADEYRVSSETVRLLICDFIREYKNVCA